MSILQPAGPHTARMWEAIAPIRERIQNLPFLTALAEGTLEPEKFVHYLLQDGLYLQGYERSMAILAGKSPCASSFAFWVNSASGAVAEEQAMQEQILSTPGLSEHVYENPQASLETQAYISYLMHQAIAEPYAVGAAAVLPCYWVYAEAGIRLGRDAGPLEEHPYRGWIEAYSDERFHKIAQRAITLVEDACEKAGEAERERAVEAFRAATRFEELFWNQGMQKPGERVFI